MEVMRWLIRLGWMVDSGDAGDLQELERDILHERTLAGPAAARTPGGSRGGPLRPGLTRPVVAVRLG